MQRDFFSHQVNGAASAKAALGRHGAPGMIRVGGLSLAMAAFACMAAVAGCADTRPQSTVSRELESGITSSNGGGMRPAGTTLGQGVPIKVP